MDDSSLSRQLAHLDERLRKIERFMLYSSIVGTVRLLIILVPLVLAVIFIPPFVKEHLPFVTDAIGFAQDLIQRGRGAR